MKRIFYGIIASSFLLAGAMPLEAMESNSGNDSGNSSSNGGYEGSGMDHTETSGGWGPGVGNDSGSWGGDWSGGMDNTTTTNDN